MTTDLPKPRRTVAFVGNCQANSLAKIYRRRIAPLLGDHVVHVAALPEQSSDDLSEALSQLAQADVIAEQKFDTPDPIPAEFFERPGIRRIRFPNLSGRFYWPYSGAAHPSTPRGQETATTIPYPKGLGDAFLNKMITDKVPPTEALQRYDEQVASNATRIARMAELHLERQAARDAECDMNFAEFAVGAYRREPVYSAQGHPGLELSRMLVTAVFDAIDVPRVLINEVVQSLEAAPFPPTEMPIHPGIAKILGLSFGAADQRYLFYDEGYFTFTEFSLRYMDYAWCPDMATAMTLLLDADYTAGIPKMREALQQCPGAVSAWHVLGFALLRTQQLEAAEAAIRQAMQLGRPYPNSFVVLADVLMQRGDVDASDAILKDAMRRFPGHPGVQNAQARLLAQRGRHEEAVAISRMVAGRDPADVTALLTLTRHLRLAGRVEQTEPVLRQALLFDPANAEALSALEARGPPQAAVLAATATKLASVAASAAATARFRPIRLEQLAVHSELLIDGKPVVKEFENLPRLSVTVPPLAFGATTGASGDHVADHPAVPAWLLRNVTVHGNCGLVTVEGCGEAFVLEETLEIAELPRIPGAGRDADGCICLPRREPVSNVHSAVHLLGYQPDDYAHWLLDQAARCGAAALGTLQSHEAAGTQAPIVLQPPLDVFWKWESLRLLLPDSMARMALRAGGDVFVQWLLYVPGLRGPDWATHPALATLFDAVRTRIAGPPDAPLDGGRRLFIESPDAPRNQARLFARAERAGFVNVVPSALSFWDQVRLFAGASHVVATHGADLANLVFCRPGTAVCELRPDSSAPWIYRHLAAMRGLRYGCVEGRPVVPGKTDNAGAAWRVERDNFEAVLQDPQFVSD